MKNAKSKFEFDIFIWNFAVVSISVVACIWIWLAIGFNFQNESKMQDSESEISNLNFVELADSWNVKRLDGYAVMLGAVPDIDVEQIMTDNQAPKFRLSDAERTVVENIVAGEAGNQPYEGMLAVAQCILNACIQDGLQPSEVRRVYQYSGWAPNFKSLYPEAYELVKQAVVDVFDNGVTVTDENILWFYNPALAVGSFHETQRHILTIESHKFFAPVV